MAIKVLTLVVSVLTLIAAIITCIFAYIIPKKMIANQLFADLVAEYRQPKMGGAILALFHFYDQCVKKGTDIDSEYKKKYDNQINNQSDDFVKVNFANTLHFQRRLVAQFYADMGDLYKNYPNYWLLRKKIYSWFTPNDLKLLKIVLLLAKPASNVFIQVGGVPEPPYNDNKMYKSIRFLYKKVKKHVIL